MADRASQSLDHILESGEYVPIEDFVVFDEHDEFNEDGKLVRRFDRARLQKIVDKCNHRAEHSGDLAVIAPGHSLDEPKSEEDQPPPWGFAHKYRLGTFGPGQKLGILCTAYILRHIRTKMGKLVNGPEYVASFPRRSPELWPNHPAIPEHARNTFDWIAVLRRAPQRDLGLSVYQRNPVYSARGELIGGLSRTHKLRYQMETTVPNPVAPPEPDVEQDLDQDQDDMGGGGDDAGMPPEGHEEFARHLDYAMANHPHLKHLGSLVKKYGLADAAMPGAASMALPGVGDLGGDAGGGGGDMDQDTDAGLMQNQRGDVRKTKYQRQLDNQELRIKRAEQELALGRKELKIKRYRMALEELRGEYDFDVEEELEDCVPMDEAAFDKHLGKIRRNYARTPVGGDFPHEAIGENIGQAGDKDLNDPDVELQIHRYMRANPEWSQKQGSNAFREAAKILKFIK